METSVLTKENFNTNVDDKHVELFCLVWLDVNVHHNRDTEQKLRSINNNLKKFDDVKQCQEYIQQTSNKDQLILIVSGSLGREIVPSIHNYQQILSIYVYCVDKEGNEKWSSKYSKVKGVVVHHDELVFQIKTDHQTQKKVDEPLSSDFSNAAKLLTQSQNMDQSNEDNFDVFFTKLAEYVVKMEYGEDVQWVLFRHGSVYVQPISNNKETSQDELISKAKENLSKVVIRVGGALGDTLILKFIYEHDRIYCGMIGSFDGIIMIHPSTHTTNDMIAISNTRENILNDHKNPTVVTTGITKQK